MNLLRADDFLNWNSSSCLWSSAIQKQNRQQWSVPWFFFCYILELCYLSERRFYSNVVAGIHVFSITFKLIFARMISNCPVPERIVEFNLNRFTAIDGHIFPSIVNAQPVLNRSPARIPLPFYMQGWQYSGSRPKSVQTFASKQVFHGGDHHISGCMMSCAKTHFQRYDDIIFYFRNCFMKMPGSHRNHQQSPVQILLPFWIPVSGLITSLK